jgi:hypothetical protein
MSRFLIGSMILVLTAASCDSATDERSVTKPRGDVQLSSKGSRLAPTPPRPDHCSRKRVRFRRREVRAVAFPRGEHPVYVGLGSPGVVHYRDGQLRLTITALFVSAATASREGASCCSTRLGSLESRSLSSTLAGMTLDRGVTGLRIRC